MSQFLTSINGMSPQQPKFGEVRMPSETELAFFKKNPKVAGMADFASNTVVTNPHSKLSPKEMEHVVKNEMGRLLQKSLPMPEFRLTSEQQKKFKGYGTPADQRATILSRIATGDPSAGKATPEQQKLGRFLKRAIEGVR